MILDKLITFSAAAGDSPTATGDNLSSFSYDTSPLTLPSGSGGQSTPGYNAGSNTNAGRDLGLGGEMWLEVLVLASVTSSSTATVQFDFVTSATAALSDVVDSTGVGVLLKSVAISKATLVAGYIAWRTQLPASLTYLRYIGVDYVIATTSLTAGTFEAKLVMNVQASDLYESGFAVQ